jgi:uncharacterized protein (TIGR00645 family)
MVEKTLEKILFAGRWLVAPFYLGLILSLGALLVTFFKELWHFVTHIGTATESNVILGILTMIDLSLLGNLVIMVVFSGYENFVSKMEEVHQKDRPDWMGTIDFSAMKLKLLGSIIAISAIHVLKAFYNVENISDRNLMWLLIIHVTFVISGLVLALSDRLLVHHPKSYKNKTNKDVAH